MKSFKQHITEVVTDAPKKKIKHEYSRSDNPKSRHNPKGDSIHDYHYPHPTHKDGHETHVEIFTDHGDAQNKHHPNFKSHFHFSVAGDKERSGVQSPKDAMKILGHAVHAGSHHLRTEKPKHFSYDVAHKETRSHTGKTKNPKARANIYKRVMHRLASSHGYELHNIKKRRRMDGSMHSVTYKRIEKK